ncbi:unnamed protein product [Closterium sp. NIES-64]|nr:unnamed protein product [Closterium sp. NIES-64]
MLLQELEQASANQKVTLSVGGKSNGESETRRQSTEAASREAQSPTRDGPGTLGLGESISGSGRKREQAERSPLDGLQLGAGGGGCGGQGFSFSPVGNPEGHQKRQETNPGGCADGVTTHNVTKGVGSRGDGQYVGRSSLGGEDARGVIETRLLGFVREEKEKEPSKGDERESEREGGEAARDGVRRGREGGWEGWEKLVGSGNKISAHDQQQQPHRDFETSPNDKEQQQQQPPPSQNVFGGDAHRPVEYRVTACEEGRRPPAWKPAGSAGHLKPDDDLTLKAFLKGGKRRHGGSAVRGAQTWQADKIADAWRVAEGLAEMERVRREQAGRGAHPPSGSANAPRVITTATAVTATPAAAGAIQRFPSADGHAADFSPYASGGAAVKANGAPGGGIARSDSARKGKAAVADEPCGFDRCASSDCTGGSSQGESSRSRGGGRARREGKRRKGSRLSGGGERKGKVKAAGAAAGDAAIGVDVTAPTDLSIGGKASAPGAKSGGGREKRGVDARADVAGKVAAQQSEKAKQMERNLKVASAQLLTLQKWDEGSRDLAVRWAVWLLRLIRKSAPTPPPPSIRLLLFSSILMTLPRIADSLLPLTSLPGLAFSPVSASAAGSVKGSAGGSVAEAVRQMLRSVCALVGAVERSQVCFSPLHWEILQEPLDRCRSLHASHHGLDLALSAPAEAAAVPVPAPATTPAAATANPLAHQPAPPLNAHSQRAFGSAQRRRQRAVEQQAKELCSGLFSPYGRQAVSGSGASSKRSDGPPPPLPPPHVTAAAAAAAADAAASPSPSASASAAASSGRMAKDTAAPKEASGSGHKGKAARAGTSVWLGTPLAAGMGAKIAVGGRGSASAVYRELSSRCGSSGGWKSGGEGGVGEEGMEEGESVREGSVGGGVGKRVREGEAGGYAEWSARNVAQTEASSVPYFWSGWQQQQGWQKHQQQGSVGRQQWRSMSAAPLGRIDEERQEEEEEEQQLQRQEQQQTQQRPEQREQEQEQAQENAQQEGEVEDQRPQQRAGKERVGSMADAPVAGAAALGVVTGAATGTETMGAVGTDTAGSAYTRTFTHTGCTSGSTWMQEGGEGPHMVSRPRSRRKKMAKRE